MVSNMVINLLLIIPLRHVGLALATSIAAFINAGLLLQGLLRADVLRLSPLFWWLLLRIALATLVMGLALLLLEQPTEVWLASSDAWRVAYLLGECLAGGLIYLMVAWAVGLRPAQFRA